LDGLAAGAFNEVVFGAEDDESACARVDAPRDLEDVGSGDVFGVGQGRAVEKPDERFTGVGGAIDCGDTSCELRRGRASGWSFGFEVERGEDAAVDWDEVRGELDGDRLAGGERELLFDLGEVAVFGDGVGAEAFVALAEQIGGIGLAPGAADAAERVGDDLSGVDQAGADEREGGEEDAGWIAAGRGDDSGVADLVPVDFREAVDGLFEQVSGGVFMAVELQVAVGALESEVGAEVDEPSAALEQWNGEFGGDSVGERKKHEVGPVGEVVDVGFGEAEVLGAGVAGEAGEHGGDTLARVLTRGNGGEVDVGMIEEAAHEFFAGITGGADYGDSNRDWGGHGVTERRWVGGGVDQ
jgi:hypothetical protein